MLRNAVCVLAIVSITGAVIPAHAQVPIDKTRCPHGDKGMRTSGAFGGELNLWYESSAEPDGQSGQTLFTRCIENPPENQKPAFAHWVGVLGPGMIKPGQRRFDFTRANGEAEKKSRPTTIIYGNARNEEEEPAICSNDVVICPTPGFFDRLFKRSAALQLQPMFSSAQLSDRQPASMKDAIAARHAEIDAYREFFVALDPANPDDLEKFAFRVSSTLDGAKLVYSTYIFASQQIRERKLDDSATLFRFDIKGCAPALLPFHGLEGFPARKLIDAASSEGLHLRTVTVDARGVTAHSVVVTVRDRKGRAVAGFIMPVLGNE